QSKPHRPIGTGCLSSLHQEYLYEDALLGRDRHIIDFDIHVKARSTLRSATYASLYFEATMAKCATISRLALRTRREGEKAAIPAIQKSHVGIPAGARIPAEAFMLHQLSPRRGIVYLGLVVFRLL